MRLANIEPIINLYKCWLNQLQESNSQAEYEAVECCLAQLEEAPIFKPVIHAEWKFLCYDNCNSIWMHQCSNCDNWESQKSPYCRHCGAKMDLGEKVYEM